MQSASHKLRVLHIISGDLWAGAEVQAYTLLSQLQPHCQLKVILMNQGRLHQECQSLGLDVEVYDESQLRGPQILWRLYRAVRQFRPHIIHTHRQKENILGTVAGRLAGCKCSVRTSHGAPEFESKGLRRLRVSLDHWIGRFAQNKVIAVSENLAEKLEALFPREHIAVIHNGVDPERLATQAAASPFSSDHCHIGIVGRLEPVKRVDLFLEMVSRLGDLPDKCQLQFHVIGDGKLRSALEAQSQTLGLTDKVWFHGHRDDIPSCLAGLNALIMCSDHEGTPMVALEALALGTPVIAHNTGGLSEILSGHPECLVENHTAQGYATAVKDLLPGLSDKRITLQERYTARHNAETTLSLYRSL
ncbi:glycosyltransferase [Marinimicrobium sp. ARAG 43.8]|uniref:glycosyltransferase n=1 Tax=Marinimicrobium sp. ARAG 43.8 TaxID=3418719 RepID=UPI003CFA7D9A